MSTAPRPGRAAAETRRSPRRGATASQPPPPPRAARELRAPAAEGAWGAPPHDLCAGAAEVHVWRAALDRPSGELANLERLLAADELERAGRFHFTRDRTRYVVARACLRSILGRYLAAAPGGLVFGYGPHGKPFLRDSPRGDLRFNAAHSADLALFAVTLGREVGVDLERMRADLALDDIAGHVFSPAELETYRRAASRDASGGPERLAGARRVVFYRLWTCKEAYIKATGTGFSVAPNTFEVELESAGAALVTVGGSREEAARWSLAELNPGAEFAGAVAAQGSGWTVRCWSWDGG